MDLGLKGKRALVLGASRGLGAASAAALAAEGVTVHCVARNIDRISGDNLSGIVADLSDTASVGRLIDTIVKDGGVDILVNNTGGPKPGPAQGQTAAGWAGAFQAMAVSIFSITAALLPGMIERQWGRVITIGSSSVVQPLPNLALSNGVRAAIAGWSKTLASEVAKHGITVNMVLPGRIATDRIGEIDEDRAKRTGSSIEAVREASWAEIPAGRYGRPEECGSVVTFLASQKASFITGSMIRIDGGMIKGI